MGSEVRQDGRSPESLRRGLQKGKTEAPTLPTEALKDP